METISDVIDKKGSIEYLWRVIDPENRHPYSTAIKEWYRLSLTEQRRLYLYCLYKKWRGETFYGTPYDIVTNCHPYPYNWNGKNMVNRLMKSSTRMVIARFDNAYGTYTLDEAKVWDMTDIKPLNF